MKHVFRVLPLMVIINSSAWATVRIDVNYDTIAREVTPEVKDVFGKGGTTIILNDNGTVTKYMGNYVSTNALDGYVSSITKSGSTSISHYKISNGVITEFYDNAGVREIYSVSTNGSNYCTARVQFRPGRGQRYIVWNSSSNTYVSSKKAINVVCRIQKTN